MKRMKSRFSGMPMIEIVVTIGIFTIISVFILKLFVSANELQIQAADISKAVIESEKIAECIKGTDHMEEAVEMLQLQEEASGHYVVHYNREWKAVKDNGVYRGEVIIEQNESETGITDDIVITIYKGSNLKGKQLYQLPVTKYHSK